MSDDGTGGRLCVFPGNFTRKFKKKYMKKKITQFRWLVTTLLLVAAMAMPKMAWAEVATSKPNGDGSAQNPYQITTAAELAWFRDHVNAGNKTACAPPRG